MKHLNKALRSFNTLLIYKIKTSPEKLQQTTLFINKLQKVYIGQTTSAKL